MIMSSFQKANKITYYNVNLFSNLINTDLKKGVIFPILDPKIYREKCLENCKYLSVNESILKECNNYCNTKSKDFLDSNDFALQQCPRSDHKCCKQYAQDNDFAYLLCRKKYNLSAKPSYSWLYVLVAVIIFLIILLFFFSNKWFHLIKQSSCLTIQQKNQIY